MKKLKLVLVAIMFLSGCQYYRVTEPISRHTYITDNWHIYDHGFFEDLSTGDAVRLSSAEYHPISEQEAKEEIGASSGNLKPGAEGHD